jgi:hypothetical protein
MRRILITLAAALALPLAAAGQADPAKAAKAQEVLKQATRRSSRGCKA